MTTRPRSEATHPRRGRRRAGAGRDRRARPRHRRLRQGDVPERLRLARGGAHRSRVRHADGAHADRAGERRRGPAPQPDGRRVRTQHLRQRLRLARRGARATWSASRRRGAGRRATTTPRRRRGATRCTSGSRSTARPSSRARAIRARAAPTTRSAIRVRADHLNVGTATVILRRTDTGAQKTWRAQVTQNPTAPGGLLVFASGDAALLRPRERLLRGARPRVAAVVGPRAGADRLRHATEGGPSARRRPCGKGAGGAPRCLVQAAAGRNGAAWALTRRQAGALSRGRRARLCRVWRGPIRMPSAGRCANAARRCARGAGNPTCA